MPATYEFLGDLLEELAAVFDGDTVHVGCDEVALSDHGLRSSAMVRERGVAAVYVDHVRAVARLARRHWRRVLFFAEFADNRYRPDVQGADDDIRALRDEGLSFVNWNYYDLQPEEYFPFLHKLQRHGVDQVISPGVWTWRQLFPSFAQTRETLPVFTRLGFQEGIADSITCAWNDTRDCFRELHWLNYAFAAEHQWNGAPRVEAGEPFIARWAEQFFGAPADALARAHEWLGGLKSCDSSAVTSCRCGTRPTSRRGGRGSRSGSPSWSGCTSRKRGRLPRGTAPGARPDACRPAPIPCERPRAAARRST